MSLPWKIIRENLDAVAMTAYRAVEPIIKDGNDRLIGTTNSGDILTLADKTAGQVIREQLRNFPVRCALLDEATGTMQNIHPNPEIGVIADEVDGSRPLLMGYRASSICLAAFPLNEGPFLKNVQAGAIQTLTGDLFSFQKGHGIWRNGVPWKPPVATADPSELRFVYEIAGGHQVLANMYMMPFAISHRYGVGVLPSSAYACTRILTGGIDFYIHLSNRLNQKWPALREVMQKLHDGATGQYAWDLAATIPLMWEAGILATYTDGSPLDNVSINDGKTIHDVLVARTSKIHQHVVKMINEQEQKLLAHSEELLTFFDKTLLTP